MKSLPMLGLATLLAVLFANAAKAEEINCYELEFTSGATVHKGFLILKGDSGQMRVRYFNDKTNKPEIVQMKMTLKSTPKGLLIESGVAIDVATSEKSPTYVPDNFLVRREPDGSVRIINVTDTGKTLESTMKLVTDEGKITQLLKDFKW